MRRFAWQWIIPPAALVALVLFWIHLDRSGSAYLPVFGLGPDSEIVRVEMKSAENDEMFLERQADGSWVLNGTLSVNEQAVWELMFILSEMIARRPVPLASSLQMDDYFQDQGIRIRVFVSAHRIALGRVIRLLPYRKLSLSLEVGPDAEDGMGTAMRLSDGDSYYWVHVPGVDSGIRQVFLPREERYRSRLLLDIDDRQIQSVSVQVPEDPELSYTLVVKEDGSLGVYLKDGSMLHSEQLDRKRLMHFLQAFGGMYFDRPVRGAEESKRKATMFTHPFMVLEITTIDGNQHLMSCYRRLPPPEINQDPATNVAFDPDRFYILTGDGEYLLAHYYFFSHVLRPVSFFIED